MPRTQKSVTSILNHNNFNSSNRHNDNLNQRSRSTSNVAIEPIQQKRLNERTNSNSLNLASNNTRLRAQNDQSQDSNIKNALELRTYDTLLNQPALFKHVDKVLHRHQKPQAVTNQNGQNGLAKL